MLGFDPALADAQIDSSPFATTFIVYALNEVKHERSIGMMMKAVDFLAREMEFGGVWRYYSSLQFKHCKIPPDLDDTSCSTYALRLAGRKTPDNEWIFHYSRDNSGRFLTWILRKPGLKFAPRFWFARMAGWDSGGVPDVGLPAGGAGHRS